MEVKPKRFHYLKRYANCLKKSMDQLKPTKGSLSKFSSIPAGYQYKHFQLKKKLNSSKIIPFKALIKNSSASPSNQVHRQSSFSDYKRLYNNKRYFVKDRISSSPESNLSIIGDSSIKYMNFIKEQEIRPKSVSPFTFNMNSIGTSTSPRKKKSIKIQLIDPGSDLVL